jgi:hypothetical protein
MARPLIYNLMDLKKYKYYTTATATSASGITLYHDNIVYNFKPDILYTGETPPIPHLISCARCGEWVKGEPIKIDYQRTATSTSTSYSYILCEACKRWGRRKRWIRLRERDGMNEYGSYGRNKYGARGTNDEEGIRRLY